MNASQLVSVQSVSHRLQQTATKMLHTLSGIGKAAMNGYRSLDLPPDMTLAEYDQIIALHRGGTSTVDDAGVRMMYQEMDGMDGLMDALGKVCPDLKNDPCVRLQLAYKAGYVPYLA